MADSQCQSRSLTAPPLFVARGAALLEALPPSLMHRVRRLRVRYRLNVLGAQAGQVVADETGLVSIPPALPPPEGWRLGEPQPVILAVGGEVTPPAAPVWFIWRINAVSGIYL